MEQPVGQSSNTELPKQEPTVAIW